MKFSYCLHISIRSCIKVGEKMKYEEDIPIGEIEHLEETTVEQQKTEKYEPKTKFLGIPLTWFAVIIAFTTKKK